MSLEAKVAETKAKIESLETARWQERQEHMDVLERIWSAIHDLKERLAMQQEYEAQLREFRAELDEFKAQRNKVIGGWITLTAIGSMVVAIGTFTWTHWDKIKKFFA